MKVCGIICEYNPFHNGHQYQLSRARALSGADFVVCAMSGPFVQRGDAAVCDKWTRAQMALEGGADLVLELPAAFAVRPAQDFAMGGAALLNGLGVVTHLSFGAENDDLARLYRFAAPETPEESERIRRYLDEGLSHPAARARALGEDMPPNVTLAVEYIRALQHLDSSIAPVPVKRDHSHHDETAHAMASATAIRLQLAVGNTDLAHAMPAQALQLMQGALPAPLPALSRFSDILMYKLRTESPAALRDAYAIPEGLEHRLCTEAAKHCSLDDLLTAVKCKRYPMARLRRLMTQMLLGMTDELLQENPLPAYARVLGFKKTAAPLLHAIKANGTLPLITKVADAAAGPLLALDLRAQNIWDLMAGNPAHRDLTERIRIL